MLFLKLQIILANLPDTLKLFGLIDQQVWKLLTSILILPGNVAAVLKITVKDNFGNERVIEMDMTIVLTFKEYII